MTDERPTCPICESAEAPMWQHFEREHPDEAAAIQRGIADMKAGRMIPLTELKRKNPSWFDA